jgi:sulfur-oxidizing protein SoxY|tara:strand:- start:5836 stop:6291 length:456 start_codon:yes stop_codon:yes gene_type:complete
MMNRRSVLKAVFTGGLVAGMGVLMPRVAMAAWSKIAFEAKSQDAAMGALYGADPSASAEVTLKAPDIAENGAVVPVSVKSSLAGVTSIALFVANNPQPLAAQFTIPEGTLASVSCRIRMGKTSDVTAVVTTASGVFSASKEVKVTIGGCGG